MEKSFEEWEEMVEEFLNETCESLKIGILEYPAGTTLREIDPIAFNEIVFEYVDNENGKITEDEERNEE